MTSHIIIIIEAVAVVFYLIAVFLAWRGFKKSSPDFEIVFGLIILAMLLGALISLTDVFQWAGVEPLFLVEGIEEVFTPLFGVIWIIATYTAIKRYITKHN